jgi:hypothetical protein
MSALASIKLPVDLIEAARQDAGVFSRSIGGQVEHWARIGQALEAVPGYSVDRIRAALEGRFDSAALCDDELRIMDDLLFVEPTAAQRQAMARIGSRPGAVGEDAEGRLVRVRADGSLKVLSE